MKFIANNDITLVAISTVSRYHLFPRVIDLIIAPVQEEGNYLIHRLDTPCLIIFAHSTVALLAHSKFMPTFPFFSFKFSMKNCSEKLRNECVNVNLAIDVFWC